MLQNDAHECSQFVNGQSSEINAKDGVYEI
jgi:hypothetical protein